jgi:hypothetical protein
MILTTPSRFKLIKIKPPAAEATKLLFFFFLFSFFFYLDGLSSLACVHSVLINSEM